MTITGALAIGLGCAFILQVGGLLLTEFICKQIYKIESSPDYGLKKPLREVIQFRVKLFWLITKFKLKILQGDKNGYRIL